MVRTVLTCTLMLLLGLTLSAEELLPEVQRELRAQKLYFGEIHGRATEETVKAIRKFQDARGLEDTGHLDAPTLRALGLPGGTGGDREEARLLDECCTFVLRYLQAWQSGDWAREATSFAPEVDYYYDQHVGRDFIRAARAAENRRWPRRKTTMLQRIASFLPGRRDRVQVTARVRTEVAPESGPARARLEDLIFRLENSGGAWRITALKMLE